MKQRELKFRAWDTKNKKWLFGYEYPNLGGFSMFGELHIMGELENSLERLGDVAVMQFTGLLDKNGKDIYEGDIIGTDKGTHEVIWNAKRGSWSCSNSISTHKYKLVDLLHKYVVIGNIYETPSLLN